MKRSSFLSLCTAVFIWSCGLLALSLWLWPGQAQAHALLARTLSSRDVCVVECAYSSGDRAMFALAKVYGPDNARVEYQNGRTDRQGRFAFLPDKEGTWTVVVTDNMGHRVEHSLQIRLSDAGLQEERTAPRSLQEALQATSMLFRTLLGLSLLANVFFLLHFLRRKKRL